MNCEKCGHEMLLVDMALFWTSYFCPNCGHNQTVGALILDTEDEEEESDPPGRASQEKP